MARKTAAPRKPPEHTPGEHLPGGRSPRNNPRPQLDTSPPQPNAPDQSEVEQQQDQQPVNPAPLINPPYPPTDAQREIRNG